MPTSPLASYFGDPELRLYLSVVAGVGGLLFLSRLRAGEEAAEGIRHALFQTVAVMTTTGFSTADYDQWSDFARIPPAAAHVLRRLRRLDLRLDQDPPLGDPLPEGPARAARRHSSPTPSSASMSAARRFRRRSAARSASSCCCSSASRRPGRSRCSPWASEPLTAVSAAAAAVTNVGPGLAEVGPASNYDALPDAGKLLLSALMIAGRLEIVTVAILVFAPIRSLRLRLRAALFRNAG